jgi:hypothetical protein
MISKWLPNGKTCTQILIEISLGALELEVADDWAGMTVTV